MDDRDRFQGLASLLDAGVTAGYAGHAGAVVAVLAYYKHGFRPAYVCALALWALVVYLQVRVRLDAGLFRWLATGTSLDTVDAFLAETGLRARRPSVPAADRIAGALRLWKWLIAAVIAEWVLLLVRLW